MQETCGGGPGDEGSAPIMAVGRGDPAPRAVRLPAVLHAVMGSAYRARAAPAPHWGDSTMTMETTMAQHRADGSREPAEAVR